MAYLAPVNDNSFEVAELHEREPKRLRSLNQLHLLDRKSHERFDRITRLAASLFDVPISTISLLDENRQWFLSSCGTDIPETSRDISFCSHALHEDTILVVENALEDSRFASNPLVQKSPSIRFYAGALIHDHEGLPLGTLCLMSDKPRSFNEKDRANLIKLAELAQNEIIPNSTSMLDRSRAQLQARIDPLTKATWRDDYLDQVDQYLKVHDDSTDVFYVVFDVRNLENLNDILGLEVGDQILLGVAERIAQHYKNSVFFQTGRLGSRRLSCAVATVANSLKEADFIDQICRSMRDPIETTSGNIAPTLHIGIARGYGTASTAAQLTDRCRMAIKELNNTDGVSAAFFAKAHQHANLRRGQIAADLQDALEHSKFHLVFQAKISSQNLQVKGFETLLRWQHNTLGYIPPPELIEVADQLNALTQLDRWVLEQAILQMTTWDEESLRYGSISVNITEKTLLDPDFTDWLSGTLASFGVAANKLDLEIVETSLFSDFDKVVGIMQKIIALGVSFSLDDFGTGYSSLAYLRTLPVRTLKIDKSFIDDIVDNDSDASMLSGLITLAHDLNLLVVAEGVEFQEQFDLLKSLQCDEIQGYFFAKPESIETCTEWLEQESFPWKSE